MDRYEIAYDYRKQRLAEFIRNGWHWAPDVVKALKSGEISVEQEAEHYLEENLTEGLTKEQIEEVIKYCLESPEY